MKYRSDDTQAKNAEKARQQKQVYKKPQLGRVSLFADQVLGICRAPLTCPEPDTLRS